MNVNRSKFTLLATTLLIAACGKNSLETSFDAVKSGLKVTDGSEIRFGVSALGESVERTVIITNGSSANIDTVSVGTSIPAPFDFKGGKFPGSGGDCDKGLAPNGSCILVLIFTPNGNRSFGSGLTLNYVYRNQTGTIGLRLLGEGKAPALLSFVAGGIVDFGDKIVRSVSDRIVTIENIGSSAAVLASSVSDTLAFDLKGGFIPGVGGSCGKRIAPGMSCSLVVSFIPLALGNHSGVVRFNYSNGAKNSSLDLNLGGKAISPAILSISDSPAYNFGGLLIGLSIEREFIVTNTGAVPATGISSVNLTGSFSFKGGAYPGMGGTCGATVAALGSCSIFVVFAPEASGNLQSTIRLSFNDGLIAATSERSVLGLGIVPAKLKLSAINSSFGNQVLQSVTDKTITILNEGQFRAINLTASAAVAPFSYKGGAYPGIGGSCAGLLAAGDSCTIIFQFSPVAFVTSNYSVEIGFFDGVTQKLSTLRLSGTGATPAELTISDGSTFDFSRRPVGSSLNKILTITNVGQVDASALSLKSPLSSPFIMRGNFPGTGGNCSQGLSAGGNCTLIVTFAPAEMRSFSGLLELNYFDGRETKVVSRPVAGTGVSPANLVFMDSPLFNFGKRAVASKTPLPITLKNEGEFQATDLAQGAPAIAAPYSFVGGFPGTGSSCAVPIQPNALCTVMVTFSPAAINTFNSLLKVKYSNGAVASETSINLTGQGATAAKLALAAPATKLAFGNRLVGGSYDGTLIFNNTGGVKALNLVASGLTGALAFKGGAYPGTGGTCGLDLIESTSCTVVITFSPIAVGTFARTLKIDYNDGVVARSLSVVVDGAGIPAAVLSVAPAITFGSTVLGASSSPLTISVINRSALASATINSVVLPVPYAFRGGIYPGTGGTCGTTLAGGATCNMSVVFSPTIAGPNPKQLTILFFDGVANRTVSSALSGIGLGPALLVLSDGPEYDFGPVGLSSFRDKVITVTNSGDRTATAVAAASGLPSGAISYKGNVFPGTGGSCTVSLGAKANCTLVIRFTPIQSGFLRATIRLNYFDAGANNSADRPVIGTGAQPARLQSAQPWVDFGSQILNSSQERAISISNSGELALSGLTGLIVANGSGFRFKGTAYPGMGGTCTDRLIADGSCTLVLENRPSAVGERSGSVSLQFNDGIAGHTFSLPLVSKDVSAVCANVPFASNGEVISDLGSVDETGGLVALSDDGKIVIAGHTQTVTGHDLFVRRLLCDGSIDTSFANNGTALIDFGGGRDSATSLKVSRSGKIIVAGLSLRNTSDRYLVIARLAANGTLDATFNGTGRQSFFLDSVVANKDLPVGVALQSDDKIVLATTQNNSIRLNDFSVTRLLSTGTLDTSFGSAGKALIDMAMNRADELSGVTLQSDGKIILFGRSRSAVLNEHDAATVRLSTSGALDSTFATAGKIVFDLAPSDRFLAASIQPDGRLLFVGASGTTTSEYPIVVRYLPNGTRDSSFAGGGLFSLESIANASARSLALLPEMRIALVAEQHLPTGERNIVLIKLTLDGSLDRDFGQQGNRILPLSGTFPANLVDFRYNVGLVVQSDGKWILASTSYSSTRSGFDPYLLRVTPDGFSDR